MALATGLALLFLFLLARVPIAYAIGLAGAIGLLLVADFDVLMGVLSTAPYAGATGYSLIAIPMFILMAEFIIIGGLADELFDAARRWVGRAPAGLGVATVFAGSLFAAMSGSSTAAAAALSGTAVPQMVSAGYSRRMSSGLVATVGTLAMMIPPSIALIFYAVLSGQSVGRMLIAGIVPGVLVALTIIGTLLVRSLGSRGSVPRGELSNVGEKLQALAKAAPVLLLLAAVVGSLYSGLATATEASAVGAVGAFVIAVARRKVTWRKIHSALALTAGLTAMILLIVIAAQVFGAFLTIAGATNSLIAWILSFEFSRGGVLAMVLVLYLVLGCFLDQMAILALTAPLIIPLMSALDYDLLWFGVLVVLVAEIGMVTPPFGLNSFIVSKYTGIAVGDVFAGAIPFVLGLLVLVVILVLFPEIILWLPSSMS